MCATIIGTQLEIKNVTEAFFQFIFYFLKFLRSVCLGTFKQ